MRAGLAFGTAIGVLVGCGDIIDEKPISLAQAQANAKIEVAQLTAVVRPDKSGHWYVQGSAKHPDPDHLAIGIVDVQPVTVIKNGVSVRALRIDFDRNYDQVSSLQVTTDDDFNDQVTAHGGLGPSSSVVGLWVRGVQIDPERIWDYVHVPDNDGGNLWVTVTVVKKP